MFSPVQVWYGAHLDGSAIVLLHCRARGSRFKSWVGPYAQLAQLAERVIVRLVYAQYSSNGRACYTEMQFKSAEGIAIVSATDTSSKKLRPYLRVNLRRGTAFLWKNLVQVQAGRRVLVTWREALNRKFL